VSQGSFGEPTVRCAESGRDGAGDAGKTVRRLAASVVGIEAPELDMLAAPPFDRLEQTGADRVLPDPIRPDRIRMRDAVAARQHAEKCAARFGEPEYDLCGRRRLDGDDLDLLRAVEIGTAWPAGFWIEETRPGPGDLARCQRRALWNVTPSRKVKL
jgi:hypothetical protein